MIRINDINIFAFSDTHGNHHRLQVPEDADIVICAGDVVEDDLRRFKSMEIEPCHSHEYENGKCIYCELSKP